MSKYVSFITILTVLLLILVTTNTITLETFLLVFAPLSIAMLVIGIIEFKNAVKDKDDVEMRASELKSTFDKRKKMG